MILNITMILNIIFLCMLCIPIGFLQFHLVSDAMKDLKITKKRVKRVIKRTQEARYDEASINKNKRLRIAK